MSTKDNAIGREFFEMVGAGRHEAFLIELLSIIFIFLNEYLRFTWSNFFDDNDCDSPEFQKDPLNQLGLVAELKKVEYAKSKCGVVLNIEVDGLDHRKSRGLDSSRIWMNQIRGSVSSESPMLAPAVPFELEQRVN